MRIDTAIRRASSAVSGSVDVPVRIPARGAANHKRTVLDFGRALFQTRWGCFHAPKLTPCGVVVASKRGEIAALDSVRRTDIIHIRKMSSINGG
jgi:hypothetical protein